MDEKELVLLAKQGDVKAFCALYDKYKRKLYSYAYFKLNNQQDAEDAVQDCALTAFEEISKLKNPDAFSAWIFRILYCACAAAIKRQIRRRETDDIDNYRNIAAADDSNIILRTDLKNAMEKLSDEEKNIVLLSVVAGLQSKEIAKITGLTAGNVRQKLSRSLAKMKNNLVQKEGAYV